MAYKTLRSLWKIRFVFLCNYKLPFWTNSSHSLLPHLHVHGHIEIHGGEEEAEALIFRSLKPAGGPGGWQEWKYENYSRLCQRITKKDTGTDLKTHLGVELELHSFFTLALDGGEWSGSRPGRFTAAVGDPGDADPLPSCEDCKAAKQKREIYCSGGKSTFFRSLP